jgi:hypothetical protein
MQRAMNETLDELMRKGLQEMLTMKVQYVAYENWVTSDSELLTLFAAYAKGGITQKKTVTQKLLHIFLTVDQNAAVRLTRRLSTLNKGDAVSERFQRAFPPPVRTELVSALQIQR